MDPGVLYEVLTSNSHLSSQHESISDTKWYKRRFFYTPNHQSSQSANHRHFVQRLINSCVKKFESGSINTSI